METSKSCQIVQLEPFMHQVGGHSSMLSLDSGTVCKPLVPRELRFYQTLPEPLRKFAPAFYGIIQVRIEQQDDDGYVMLVATPPQFYRPRTQSGNAKLSRIRLRRNGTIEIEGGNVEEIFEAEVRNRRVSTTLNPWSLRCHRDNLRNLIGAAHNKTTLQNFILLENLTSRFCLPCVLDLKMGTRQYSDLATPAKRRSKMIKVANTTSGKIGIRLGGMQVYQVPSKHYLCQNKFYGRELSVDGFEKTLYQFLHNGERVRTEIIPSLIKQLQELTRVLEQQETFRFYTSSLLILYDGDTDLLRRKSSVDINGLKLEPLYERQNGSSPMINSESIGTQNGSNLDGIILNENGPESMKCNSSLIDLNSEAIDTQNGSKSGTNLEKIKTEMKFTGEKNSETMKNSSKVPLIDLNSESIGTQNSSKVGTNLDKIILNKKGPECMISNSSLVDLNSEAIGTQNGSKKSTSLDQGTEIKSKKNISIQPLIDLNSDAISTQNSSKKGASLDKIGTEIIKCNEKNPESIKNISLIDLNIDTDGIQNISKKSTSTNLEEIGTEIKSNAGPVMKNSSKVTPLIDLNNVVTKKSTSLEEIGESKINKFNSTTESIKFSENSSLIDFNSEIGSKSDEMEPFFTSRNSPIDVIGRSASADAMKYVPLWNKINKLERSHSLQPKNYDEDADYDFDESIIDVRIIDFAHSTHKGLGDPIEYSGPDQGFLFGIENLISILKNIQMLN